MKYSAAALLSLGAIALSKEIPKNPTRALELYDSGLMHERIMSEKELFWAQRRKAGIFTPKRWPELHYTQCRDGKATPFSDDEDTFYRCNNVRIAFA